MRSLTSYIYFLDFSFVHGMYNYIQSKKTLFYDLIEYTTLQIRNKNTLLYTFCLNTVTINSPVKNLVARSEYANIKYRNDGGCLKMDIN